MGSAWAGSGRSEVGSGLQARLSRVGFLFSNLFLIPETISENLEIVLKARKILEISQKFQENS
jgi:hypothetical protein